MAELEQRRMLKTSIPGPRSIELMARKSGAVARGVGTTMPVFAMEAGGGVVVDVDGNSLIDFGSGIAVTTIGNSAPRVVAAVQDQVELFTHTCFMITPYEGYVAVAEQLNELTPGDYEKRSALFNSGAEAVENAVKIARAYTKKQAVVAFDHAYHGRTNLAMALTAKSMPYKHSFGPFAPEVYRAPLSYPYRDDKLIDGELAARRATRPDRQAGRSGKPGGGDHRTDPGRGRLHCSGRRLPARHWPNGVGPTRWSSSRTRYRPDSRVPGPCLPASCSTSIPDLIVTAKGIAGGLPLAAVTGRIEIMDAAHVGGLGGTYGGNPVACAASLAAIETIKAENLVARAGEIERIMLTRLHRMQSDDNRIGDVRGRGAMIAVELVHRDTSDPDPGFTAAVAMAAREQGVIVLTCGTYGNVLRFLPPLAISDELLNEGLDVLAEAFASL